MQSAEQAPAYLVKLQVIPHCILDHTQQPSTLSRGKVTKHLLECCPCFGVHRGIISQQSSELVKDLLLQRMPYNTGFGSA